MFSISFSVKRIRLSQIYSDDRNIAAEELFAYMLADCTVRMILHNGNAETVLQRQILRFPESKDQISPGKISEEHLWNQCGTVDSDRQRFFDLIILCPASHIGNIYTGFSSFLACHHLTVFPGCCMLRKKCSGSLSTEAASEILPRTSSSSGIRSSAVSAAYEIQSCTHSDLSRGSISSYASGKREPIACRRSVHSFLAPYTYFQPSISKSSSWQ